MGKPRKRRRSTSRCCRTPASRASCALPPTIPARPREPRWWSSSRWPALHGPQRRSAVPLHGGRLLRDRLRGPGGGRPALGRPHGRRRRAGAMRLAQGPLRPVLAGRAQGAARTPRRPRPRARRPRHAGHDDDEQDRHRRAPARLRRRARRLAPSSSLSALPSRNDTMPATPNAFVWYELMTTDPDAAEAFYRAVVGWGAQDAGQGGMPYTLLTADDRHVAGLMGLPQEACAADARPGWIGYIGVDDVDAAADGIHQAGGAAGREPADIPGVGRFAVVADPQGATFMLFKPMGASFPLAPAGTPGHVDWRELYAADGARAFGFYADRFGWTKA